MSTAPNPPAPQWDDLAKQIRAYCRARWQAEPLRVQFDFANFGSASLPMPSWEARIPVVEPSKHDPPPDAPAVSVVPADGPRDAQTGKPMPILRIPESQHTEDFAIVVWQGVRYALTRKQAHVVRALWRAWREGQPDLSQRELLKEADSDGVRLVDLFRRNPAWQNLIISVKSGYYRLAGPGIEVEEIEDAG